MNERQPYEQLIADKLQQLPAPDVNTSWQQMKRLLDENQSPGDGGGRKRFRPGGGGGGWGAGIIAGALIVGIWVFRQTHTAPQQASLASAKHAAATSPAAGNKDAPSKNSASGETTFNHPSTGNTTDQTSTQKTTTDQAASQQPATPASTGNAPAADAATPGSYPDNTRPATNAPVAGNDSRNSHKNGHDNNGGANNSGANNNDNGNAGGSLTATTASSSAAPSASLPVAADNNRPASDYSKSLPKKKKASDKTASNRARRNIPLPGAPGHNTADKTNRDVAAKTHHTPGNAPAHHNTGANATASNSTVRRRPSHGNPAGGRNRDIAGSRTIHPSGTKPTDAGATGAKDKPNGNAVANPADEQLLAKQRERRAHLRELLEPTPHGEVNGALAAGDSVNPYKDTSHLLNDKTKALIAKSRQPQKNEAVAQKTRKPVHIGLRPFTFKADANTDPWWGAGLSFNAPMPVGGQNRFNQNVNGGSSLLTDYLPSPYVEFHLNSGMYLQTEINLSAPQYVPLLCLYQKPGVPPGGGPNMHNEKAIYIQKLYYFNWPFSLHYSPFANLYLTTGLQFSSLQSGLAQIKEKRFTAGAAPADTSFTSQTIKFKDDSIAGQLRPNEWRWQLGAEYYWNRFTLGMRYNRSFSDLVTVGPANGVPDAKIRNSAFLFFIRFNFFEGRKKDNGSASTIPSLVRY